MMDDVGTHAWDYRTIGFGHDESWWKNLISALRLAGYDGVLSIEHEDRMLGTREGIQKSVSFLKSIILRTLPV